MTKQLDNSTIRIYKRKSGYRALLICPENGEPVGHTSKGYPTVAELAQALIEARDSTEWFVSQNKGKYYFRCYARLSKRKQLLRSEPYASWHNAHLGVNAAKTALTANRVACLFSDNTDVVKLESLLTQ